MKKGAIGKPKKQGGARPGAGRPRIVPHVPGYAWCRCADCRKEKATA